MRIVLYILYFSKLFNRPYYVLMILMELKKDLVNRKQNCCLHLKVFLLTLKILSSVDRKTHSCKILLIRKLAVRASLSKLLLFLEAGSIEPNTQTSDMLSNNCLNFDERKGTEIASKLAPSRKSSSRTETFGCSQVTVIEHQQDRKVRIIKK